MKDWGRFFFVYSLNDFEVYYTFFMSVMGILLDEYQIKLSLANDYIYL